MPNISIAANIGEARAVMDRARELGAHPRPLLELAGTILEESTRNRFRTGVGPGGIPWPVSRRAALQGGRTLIDKGGLVSSITNEASEQRVEVGVIAKTPSARFGYVHQFGARILPKKGPFLVFKGADGHLVFSRGVTIPARPFLGVDDQDRRDLLDAWKDYMREALGEH